MRDMGYAPVEDERRGRKTPVGGVPLFPGLQPVSHCLIVRPFVLTQVYVCK